MTNDSAVDAHPEAGSIQGGEDASDSSGQTVDDAVEGAYDSWDAREHGISEGWRKPVGQWLQGHAREAGTTIETGLQSLVQTAGVLRSGDQAAKREMLGFLVDQYGVQDIPMAQDQPIAYGPPAVGEAGQPVTEAEGMAVVEQFVAANPAAQDGRIQESMIHVIDDMRRQGFQPNLAQAFEIAVGNDVRYSPAARQAQQADEVSRAKAASVQVSGSGSSSPNQTSDDLSSLINELMPSW